MVTERTIQCDRPSSPSPKDFLEESLAVLRKMRMSRIIAIRRFRGLFGTTPAVCAKLWSLIVRREPEKGKPLHCLWALLFLKVYTCK